MKKLRVGVFVKENYHPNVGGGYSYYTRLLGYLINAEIDNVEIVFLFQKEQVVDPCFSNCKIHKVGWKKNKTVKINLVKKIANKIASCFGEIPFPWFFKGNIDELRQELKKVIDVVYYLTPECAYPDFPFIVTHWDVGHMSTFAFPEVSYDSVYDERDLYYQYFIPRALAITCESDAGKKELVKYCNINPSRIFKVRMFSTEIAEDTIKPSKVDGFNVGQYFVYPAQFWSHKNHYNLLLAFKQVLKLYPETNLVLTGSDKGNLAYVLSVIDSLGVKKNVHYFGFVEQSELKWLYQNACGLVFPSFLGPTNIPLLEAGMLGCPVACSDFTGHREMLGDYAYYFDPARPDEIANRMLVILKDIESGVYKEFKTDFTFDNTIKDIKRMFEEVSAIRGCWS